MDAELKDAYRYCGGLARRKAGNFYYAFRFLPPAKRRGIFALYAFCQHGDRLVDELSPGDNPRINLKKLKNDLDDCYEGKSGSPLFLALGDSVRRYALPRKYFDSLIEGMESDLERRRYETFDELADYCYQVASTVGLLCVEIFGYSNKSVKRYAKYLGIAMQLTNIIRDVKEDGHRGRIYLPLEDLERFRYSQDDLANNVYNEKFRTLMQFQYFRAVDYYRRAVSALPSAEVKGQMASEIMRVIYMELLENIRIRKFQVFDGRISLDSRRKSRLALGTYIKIKMGLRDKWALLR